MPVTNYATIAALIQDALARSDLASQTADAITLFEAEATDELFRTRGTEVRTILIPTSPAALTITNAANNGAGLIRITYSGTASPAIVTGNIINISSVGGTVEANGSWVVTVIDAQDIDLQGSAFVNAYTSGGTAQQDQGFAPLPADYLGWRRVTFTGTPQRDLEYISPAVWDEAFPNWEPIIATSIPEVFTIEAGFLKIKPVNTGTLEFIYWQNTPALAANFNWLATTRPDAYVMGALEKLYGIWIKDFNQAEAYGRKKDQIFSQIKMQRFREFNNLRIRLDRSAYGATP